MENDINERIKLICEKLFDGNTTRMANVIDLPRTTLSSIIGSKKAVPSAEIAKKIVEISSVSPDWLLTGEGDMLKDEVQDAIHSDKLEDKYRLIPLVNIDSVGGMVSSNALTEGEQFIVRYIPFTDARDGDVAIYQSGDSMTPGIPAGSILQIRQIVDWQEYFGYGNIFVLWLKDDRRITKQVLKYAPDPKTFVTCHSFNPQYEDEELPKKFIKQVWKVIKVLSDKGW